MKRKASREKSVAAECEVAKVERIVPFRSQLYKTRKPLAFYIVVVMIL